MTSMDKQTWLKVTAIDLLMLCFSISVSIVGQMLSPINEAYSLSLSQSGWLVSSQSIGGIALALLTIFYSEINKEKFVLVSGVLLGAMLLLLGFKLPVALLFAVFMLIGYSGSSINALSNSVISDTVPLKKTDRHLSLLHFAFSLGAVITPMLSQYIYDIKGLNGVFLVFGAFIILSVVYAIYSFRKHIAVKTSRKSISLKERFTTAISTFKRPAMRIVFILAIFISSAQLTLIYYMSSYFSQIGGSANYGAAALSTFFLCMLLSRLLYSRIAGRYSKGAVIAAATAAALVSWTIMFFIPGTVAKIVFMGLGSFFYANNFPILYSSSMDVSSGSKASATGFVVLGYYIALLAFLPIAGALGETYGLKIAITSALAPTLGVVVTGIILHLRVRRLKEQG